MDPFLASDSSVSAIPYSARTTGLPRTKSTASVKSFISSPIKSPIVYGAPGVGLFDPPSSAARPPPSNMSGEYTGYSGGTQGSHNASGSRSGNGMPEVKAPFLRVRIGGLERNRKDLLIRFDASTNLPGYKNTLYRNMQRSYLEFQRFAEQAFLTSPQTIIPALPLPSTSAVTDEEDDRLVRIALQGWFSRICEDDVLLQSGELRAFIEADFAYQPIPPPSARRPMSASSSATNVFSAALSKVVGRGPTDEDDVLAAAKGALEKLETNWGGAAAAVGALGKARRSNALSDTDIGAKLISLSTVESDGQLAIAERKLGRSMEQLASMAGAQAASENVVLTDSLGYQSLNAKAAKDSLLQRTQILEDAQSATKSAITKRRNVERLKGSSSINPVKVDDAIGEMREADELERQLNDRLEAMSRHLHIALRSHSRQTHEDVALALLENARLTIGYHKHALRELEALKPDIARIGSTSTSTVTSPLSANSAPVIPNVPSTMGAPSAYQTPPRASAPPIDTSKSMFLPRPQYQLPEPPLPRPGSANATPQNAQYGRTDPLGGGTGMGQTQSHPGVGGGMTQSVMLPGTHGGVPQNAYPGQNGQPGQAPYPGHQPPHGRAQTMGRAGGRKLDERQAAKLLAGGF